MKIKCSVLAIYAVVTFLDESASIKTMQKFFVFIGITNFQVQSTVIRFLFYKYE
jgi:hypothetical protein